MCNECTEKAKKSVASKANCAFRNTNEMRKIRITNVYTRNGVEELKSRLNGKNHGNVFLFAYTVLAWNWSFFFSTRRQMRHHFPLLFTTETMVSIVIITSSLSDRVLLFGFVHLNCISFSVPCEWRLSIYSSLCRIVTRISSFVSYTFKIHICHFIWFHVLHSKTNRSNTFMSQSRRQERECRMAKSAYKKRNKQNCWIENNSKIKIGWYLCTCVAEDSGRSEITLKRKEIEKHTSFMIRSFRLGLCIRAGHSHSHLRWIGVLNMNFDFSDLFTTNDKQQSN